MRFNMHPRQASRFMRRSAPVIALASVLAATLLAGCNEGGDVVADVEESSQESEPIAYTGRLTEAEIQRRIEAAPKTVTTTESGETAYRLPAPELLARLVLPDGGEARFLWSPITNDVIFSGWASDSGTPLFDPARSMLDNYIELAGQDAPIPRALLELDERVGAEQREQVLATREVVERLREPLHIDAPAGAQQKVVQPAGATASCEDAMWFADNHCYYLNNDLVAPNRHDAIWCCDENYPSACGRNPSQGDTVWFSLIRESGSFRKNSYSETAACGVDVAVQHYFKFAGSWTALAQGDQVVPSDNVYYLFYMGGAWYDRKIEFDRTASSGGLRAYSEFTNP